MRLFIAINFDSNTIKTIMDIQGRLRRFGKGNFTRQGNLHLTLAFLGEVEPIKAESVKEIMDDLTIETIQLQFNRVGKFTRGDEYTYWLGLEKNNTLSQLQHELTSKLKSSGFNIDSRKFSPHITLARRMILHSSPDSSSLLSAPFGTTVNKISLMRSHHIDGLLTYTKQYEVYCR